MRKASTVKSESFSGRLYSTLSYCSAVRVLRMDIDHGHPAGGPDAVDRLRNCCNRCSWPGPSWCSIRSAGRCSWSCRYRNSSGCTATTLRGLASIFHCPFISPISVYSYWSASRSSRSSKVKSVLKKRVRPVLHGDALLPSHRRPPQPLVAGGIRMVHDQQRHALHFRRAGEAQNRPCCFHNRRFARRPSAW